MKAQLEIKYVDERCLYSCQFLKLNRFDKDECRLFDKELKHDDIFVVRCQKCIDIVEKSYSEQS